VIPLEILLEIELVAGSETQRVQQLEIELVTLMAHWLAVALETVSVQVTGRELVRRWAKM
jgi:hypothetical protein